MREDVSRNKRIVDYRLSDPRRWTFGVIAKVEETTRQRAHQLFEEHVSKYATPEQIKDYREKVAQLSDRKGFSTTKRKKVLA